MKRFVGFAVATAVAVLVSASAQASAISLLSTDGIRDLLEDDDFESLINVDGSTSSGVPTITENDIFVGIFRINFIDGNNAAFAGFSFAGVIVAAVDDVSGSTVTFRAVTADEYADLKDGSLGGLGGIALSNLPTRLSDDSAIIVYDDANPPNFITNNGAGTGFTGVNNAIATATNGTKVFEFGFVGDAEAYATIGGGSIGVLSFQLALNETANLTSLVLLDVSEIPGLNPTQMQVNGDVDSVNPLDTGDFQLRTDANIYINPIPEPGSLTLLGLGAIGLLGGARLRRKQAA